MSYTRTLRQILEDKNPTLYHRLENIEQKARSVLTYTASLFPYYTPHDFQHSLSVEEKINWIIDDDEKVTLNDYEIFFLIIATWLHDWGMVGSYNEDLLEVRNLHHERTEKYFEEKYVDVLLDYHEARIIGKICRGHTKDDISRAYYDDEIFSSNIRIRVRFLTCCLRIADECDITYNRTPEIIYHSISPLKENNEENFKKHLSISGIGRPQDEKYKIVINGIAWNPKGVEVLNSVKDKIQTELNVVKPYLAQYGVILSYCDLRIDTKGFINKPIEFELNKEKIVNLLIGKNLYSKPEAAIRELIQNSVDACNLKKHLYNDYDSKITISYDLDKLIVEDNGIGMNFEDAKEFLSKKGTSYYESNNLKKLLKNKKFEAISQFGIGVLSYFMISDKLMIETKKKDNKACKFKINNISEGWRYEESSKKTCGTKITLYLNELGKKLKFKDTIIHYIKNVEPNIELINLLNGESENIMLSWNYNIDEIKEDLYLIKDGVSNPVPNDIKDYIKFHDIIQTDSLTVKYYLLNEKSGLCANSKNIYVCKKGIYVGSFDYYDFGPSQYLIVLVNIIDDSVDLSVSREIIIKDIKYNIFREKLNDCLIQFIHNLIKKLKLNNNNAIKFHSQFFKNVLHIMGTQPYDRFKYDLIWKIISNKLYPIIINKKLVYMRGYEIMDKKYYIYRYIVPHDFYDEQIKLLLDALKKLTDDNTIILIDLGPYFTFWIVEDDIIYNKKDAFQMGCENYNIKIHNLTVEDILSEYHYEIKTTEIDKFIPKHIKFVNMPSFLSNYAFSIKNPIFSETDSYYFQKDILENIYLKKIPAVTQYIEILKKSDYKQYKILEYPVVYVDINDLFVQKILKNIQKIKSNQLILELIYMYFVYLIIVVIYGSINNEWSRLIYYEHQVISFLEEEKGYIYSFIRLWNKINILRSTSSIRNIIQ